MEFEWDPHKNQRNLHKHNLSFQEAVQIFDYPTFTRMDSRKDYGKTRYITLGTLGKKSHHLYCLHKKKQWHSAYFSQNSQEKRKESIL